MRALSDRRLFVERADDPSHPRKVVMKGEIVDCESVINSYRSKENRLPEVEV